MTIVAGLDVGTTAVKGVLVELETGAIAARAEVPYPTSTPSAGRVEQDPADWLRSIAACAEQLLFAAAGTPVALGVCSQVNTHVFADDRFAPVRPAINWRDQRCAAIAGRLDAAVAGRRLDIWNGPFTIDASCSLARAAWVAEYEPEAWARTRWVLSPKDFCIGVLTGDVRTDRISPIGLVGGDGAYIDAALDLVDGFGARAPALAEFDEPAGTTNGTLGLPGGLPVAVGTMDVWGALYGSGVVDPGTSAQLSGTSEVVGVFSQGPGGTDGVISFPPVRGRFLHAGPTQAGGEALRWIAATLGLDVTVALARAAAAAERPKPIVFLPYLDGERAPLWSAAVSGVFVGVTSRSDAGDLVLAVLEGVAHAARHVRERCEDAAGCRPEALRLSGGATRSRLWNEIKANTHDRQLQVVSGGVAGATGAALMGAVAAGLDDDLESLARATVRVSEIVEPEPAAVRRLDALHQVYRETSALLVEQFVALHRLAGESGPSTGEP